MAIADTARLVAALELDTTKFLGGVNKALGGVGKLDQGLGRAGKGVAQLGLGITRAGVAITAIGATGLTAAAKAAIDFEDAFAGVRKTVDETDLAAAGLSFRDLELEFRRMATQIPISASEFARLGEQAGALGVRAEDITEFSRVTALMGVTTDLTADQAADAFGRIGTILGLTGKDYEDLADIIVALGNDGASMESEIVEITKRFGAEGKAAGLAKEQIAGLASATAALGFGPERGGTALSRVFANLGANISLANDEGKALSKLVGKPIKDLQKDLNKGKGLDIFLDVLGEIQGMSATDANKTLKALGVTNTSDRTIFRSMSDQLPFINKQLQLAANATGALSEEAEKRFDTIASKLVLLKNNIIEAGIAVGEGMLPAIGRATDKLQTALQDPAFKAQLTKLGQDVGKFIDDIDWNSVLSAARTFADVLMTAFDWAQKIFGVISKLPVEVQAAGAGFLGLNKLTGGLLSTGLGNIVGGLGQTLTRSVGASLPGVGRAFAQPVFVTNWPVGGLGGGGNGLPAAVGAAGAIGTGTALALVAGSVAISGISTLQFADKNNQMAGKGLNSAEIEAVKYYQSDRAAQERALKYLGQAPSRADFASGLAKLGQVDRAIDDVTRAVDQQSLRTLGAIDRAASTARSAAWETTRAIKDKDLMVNNNITVPVSVSVKGFTAQQTFIKRYGSSGTSRTGRHGGPAPVGNGV